jgi:hypothetical protein
MRPYHLIAALVFLLSAGLQARGGGGGGGHASAGHASSHASEGAHEAAPHVAEETQASHTTAPVARVFHQASATPVPQSGTQEGPHASNEPSPVAVSVLLGLLGLFGLACSVLLLRAGDNE